jgi:TonB-dependent receptor
MDRMLLKKGGFLLLLLSIWSNGLFAGIIKGTATDKKTGEPIVGAVVLLDNGSIHLNATTGLDGTYTVKNAPVGTYNIAIKYSGYEVEDQQVTITERLPDVVVNLAVYPKAKELKEVQIRTKYKNGSEEQARNIEKSSDAQVNVMSARAIQLLPDITVANVLQRISGVAVQRDATGEARYAIIRGMDKRYNTTTVNGIKIPSPDDKARYVPMDIFPAEILERLEVVKSLTPNMEADAIGGTMNMVLKSAPDKLTVHASAATGFNETLLDRSYTSFNSSVINSQDPYRANGAAYNATANDFARNNLVFNQNNVKPNSLFSLTLGNRFGKNKKLGAIFSGSYQNTFKGSSSIFFKPSAQPDINNVAQFTDLEIYKYDKQQTRTGLHGLVNYDFNSRNTISLYGLFTQLNEQESRYIIDTAVSIQRTGAGTGPVDIYRRSAVRKQNISSVSLKGKHELTDKISADWTLAISRAKRDVPDMAELHTSTGVQRDGATGNLTAIPETINSVHHSWENTTEQDQQAFVNLHYTPTVAKRDIEFSAGGMYRHKTRDNYYNDYKLTGLSGKGATYNSIMTDSLAITTGGGKGTQPINDLTYTSYENISAGYVQAKTMLGKKLQVLAGVRVEHTHQHYEMAEDPKVFVGQNGTFDYLDVLPGLHLKYKLNPKTNIRLSYFESITRPALFELAPQGFSGEEFSEHGNPYLKHTVAQNIDLRYEWFPKGVDQILVGAFYKSMLNPIEYSLDPLSGPSALDIVPRNPNGTDSTASRATNFGLELQVTKFFHYFGVSFNYTYTNSSIHAVVIDYHNDPVSNTYKKTPVEVTRPLQGQSAHIGNLSLLYKNPVMGLDAQLALAYTGEKIAFVSNFKDLNYWQKALMLLDFSVEKRITKGISIYAKLNNLLNTATIVELRQDKTRFVSTAPGNYYQLPYQDLPNSVIVRKELFGRNYLVGIRFKLN